MTDLRRIQVAIASVFALFAFLVAFIVVSDRFGGAPTGEILAGTIAVVIFVVAFAIAPRLLSKGREGQAPGSIPPVAVSGEDEAMLAVEIDEDAGEETIFDRKVIVPPGRGGWEYEIPLDVGEHLEGSLREVDGQTFNWMITTQSKYHAWINGEDADFVEGEEDVRAATIDWIVPRKERWFLVLDAYGKQYPRDVRVLLRRTWKSE
ncbi:MAG TPA: hypothetical protein VJP06_07235 [Thermoplasmata archaeon]|nr:hypothetical protein [Thermoplasmata archaeon]